MRRPNQASRLAGTGVVSGQRGRGRPQSPGATETAIKPAEDAGPSTLESVEHEVLQLKMALESEMAEVAGIQSTLQELFGRNACEEYLFRLEKRIQVIENREVDTIQWTIENVEKVRAKFEKGSYLASPEFSACGLGGFSFHLYPKGDDFADEGYCSLYFHVPRDTVVHRILFLGKERHGPAEADALKNCGISEMCVLSNEIDKETGSIVVGVEGLKIISSPHVVETRQKIILPPPM